MEQVRLCSRCWSKRRGWCSGSVCHTPAGWQTPLLHLPGALRDGRLEAPSPPSLHCSFCMKPEIKPHLAQAGTGSSPLQAPFVPFSLTVPLLLPLARLRTRVSSQQGWRESFTLSAKQLALTSSIAIQAFRQERAAICRPLCAHSPSHHTSGAGQEPGPGVQLETWHCNQLIPLASDTQWCLQGWCDTGS